MKKVTFGKSTVAALMLSFAMPLLIVSPADALKFSNLQIGKKALAKACESSGGKSYTENGGIYGCTVEHGDGGTTVISCEEKGNCSGIVDDRNKTMIREMRQKSNSGAANAVKGR